MAKRVSDELVDAVAVSGTPDEVAAKLDARCGFAQRVALVTPYGVDPRMLRDAGPRAARPSRGAGCAPRISLPGRAPVSSPSRKITSPGDQRGAIAVRLLHQPARAGGQVVRDVRRVEPELREVDQVQVRAVAGREHAAVAQPVQLGGVARHLAHHALERRAARRARDRAPSA